MNETPIPNHKRYADLAWATEDSANQLAADLIAFLETFALKHKGHLPDKPGHRVKFHWPPPPVSYRYHVLASDWTGHATFTSRSETYDVKVARTPNGVFGRCDELWLEAKGDEVDDMLIKLEDAAEPYFERMRDIGQAIGKPGRTKFRYRDMTPLELCKLLYARDRDVANDARVAIEKQASNRLFMPAFVAILRDEFHPRRRSAQWCVLDLLEDLSSYCRNKDEEQTAVTAMRNLIWSATDDFARTIYKAGVVLGGNLPELYGGPVLVECLDAPSKIGRRSAIHGLFHVVEWVPELRNSIIAELRAHELKEADPLLREFAKGIAADLQAHDFEHRIEPVFSDET